MKSTGFAIVGGAVIIAFAIAFTFRWEIVPLGQSALRLDRWTGKIVACLPGHGEPAQRPEILFAEGGSIPFRCETAVPPGRTPQQQ